MLDIPATLTEHTGSQEWAQGLKADGVTLTLLRRGVTLGWKNGVGGGSRRAVRAHRCEGSEMQVAERMRTAVILVRPADSVRTALKLLGERQIRHLPVVEDGKLVGIVTDRDIRLVFPSAVTADNKEQDPFDALEKVSVDQIMTKRVLTVTPETSIVDAARLLLERRIGGLPVVQGDLLVGIITKTDILAAFVEIMQKRPQ